MTPKGCLYTARMLPNVLQHDGPVIGIRIYWGIHFSFKRRVKQPPENTLHQPVFLPQCTKITFLFAIM